LQKKITNFKKRNFIKIKKINLFFFIKILLFKQYTFYYYYYFYFKKYLKSNFKLKYSKNFKIKLWIFFLSNFFISKKSKNSRMGKGKGCFYRHSTRLEKNFIILKFYKFNILRIKKLIYFWKKKFNLKLNFYI